MLQRCLRCMTCCLRLCENLGSFLSHRQNMWRYISCSGLRRRHVRTKLYITTVIPSPPLPLPSDPEDRGTTGSLQRVCSSVSQNWTMEYHCIPSLILVPSSLVREGEEGRGGEGGGGRKHTLILVPPTPRERGGHVLWFPPSLVN